MTSARRPTSTLMGVFNGFLPVHGASKSGTTLKMGYNTSMTKVQH